MLDSFLKIEYSLHARDEKVQCVKPQGLAIFLHSKLRYRIYAAMYILLLDFHYETFVHYEILIFHKSFFHCDLIGNIFFVVSKKDYKTLSILNTFTYFPSIIINSIFIHYNVEEFFTSQTKKWTNKIMNSIFNLQKIIGYTVQWRFLINIITFNSWSKQTLKLNFFL